jgi:hypothetical protein
MPIPESPHKIVGNAADEAQFLEAYGEYAKTLRAWLVAYGIGAPVLFFSNDKVSAKMAMAAETPLIAKLFLVGVTLQVVLAALNKTVMWACYHRERNLAICKDQKFFTLMYWLSDQFWIDFVVDLATGGLFIYATWRTFSILVPGA